MTETLTAAMSRGDARETPGPARHRQGPVLDRGWAWAVLVSCCFSQILLGLIYTVGMFNLIFLDVFGKDRQTTAWPIAVQMSLLSLAAPISMLINKRVGLRWTAIIGGLIGSTGFFLTYFATSFLHLFITFGVLIGLGNGIAYMPFILAIGIYFRKHRNMVYGLTFAAIGVSTMVMPVIIKSTTNYYGWRGCMLIMCGLQLQLVVCGAILRPQDISLELEDTPEPERSKGSIYGSYHSLSIVLGNLQQVEPRNSKGEVGIGHMKAHCSLQELNVSKDHRSLLYQVLSKSHHNLRFHSSKQALDSLSQSEEHHTDRDSSSCTPQVTVGNGVIHAHSQYGCDSEHYHPDTPEFHAHSQYECHSQNHNPDTQEFQIKLEDTVTQHKKESFHSKCSPFRDKNILILFMNCLLVSAAITLAFLHFPAYMLQQGAASADIMLVWTVLGISNIFCRLLMGAATNSGDVSALIVYFACGGISAVFILFLPLLSRSVAGRLVFAVGFGFYGNVFNVLMVPVTLELFTLDKLAVVHSVNLVGCGVGGLIGPPMAGWIYDISGGYTTFIVAGVLHLVGSLCMLLIPLGQPAAACSSNGTVAHTASDTKVANEPSKPVVTPLIKKCFDMCK